MATASWQLAKTESRRDCAGGVLAVYGLTELDEGHGFIAAFISGLVLRRQESQHDFHTKLHDFTKSIKHALTAILLSASALSALATSLSWTGTAIGLALIFVVRPLAARL